MQRVFFALHYFFVPARHGRRANIQPDADGLTQQSPRHSAPPSASASGGIGQGREAATANPCPMLADVLPRKMARGAGGRDDDRRQPLPQNQNALKAALLFAPASGALEPSPRGFCGGGSGGSASRMTRRSPFPCTDAGTDGRTRKPTGMGRTQRARGRRRVVFAAVACETMKPPISACLSIIVIQLSEGTRFL